MDFIPAEIIRKKRFGEAHTAEEIKRFIGGYARGKIADAQAAAWLMAVCLRGMTDEETWWLTSEMRDSGVVLDLSELGCTVDKHSTGGVGDKVSLILAPLAAACGVCVPMIAGRGLGHTGGTIDKLESIHGFSTALPFEQFKNQINAVGTAIMGQTIQLAPADRKLYALRDVTGTIDSLPLIGSSIMSKKLAEGMSALVLDVKVGSGAFMKTIAEAERLAQTLTALAHRAGKKVTAVLTRMDEPLGRFIGNALEVKESLDILRNQAFSGAGGKSYADTLELTLELAGHMVHLSGRSASPVEGKTIAERHLKDGTALSKFEQLVSAQGGDLSSALPLKEAVAFVRAPTTGFMHYIDVEKIGLAAVLIGAGRKFPEDRIDPGAGLEVFREQGEPVEKDETLFAVFANSTAPLEAALSKLRESFAMSDTPMPRSPLVHKFIGSLP